jgi:hypothetical protein
MGFGTSSRPHKRLLHHAAITEVPRRARENPTIGPQCGFATHIYPLIALVHSQTVTPSLARILAIDKSSTFPTRPKHAHCQRRRLDATGDVAAQTHSCAPSTTSGKLAMSMLGQKSAAYRHRRPCRESNAPSDGGRASKTMCFPE